MNRQQAINYLLSSGFSEEQINTIEQAFKQEPTTKNDLAVAEMIKLVRESDVIDRTDGSELAKAFNYLFDRYIEEPITKNYLGVSSGLEKNSKKLEKNFGELDCISRADVLKLMQDNWHTHNGDWAMQESMDDIRALPSVTPQEPIEPMVEIDLYSVIRQKYIEREVLDKIRIEIEKAVWEDVVVSLDGTDEVRIPRLDPDDVFEIIDKYKAESEKA